MALSNEDTKTERTKKGAHFLHFFQAEKKALQAPA